MPQLDHLVYGVVDLLAGVTEFAARTGVMPVAGGRHVGRGTANYLVGLGSGAYLEIIGPDPAAAGSPQPRLPFGLDTLTAPRLVTWCVRPSDLDQCLIDARSRGYDPGEATAMSRRTPSGALLEWRLTPDSTAGGGLMPFLIDWGTSAHPTSAGLPSVRLMSLHASCPQPEVIRSQLATIGLILDVTPAEHTELHATLDTPRGEVTL
jgi:glyoxalase-like protein